MTRASDTIPLLDEIECFLADTGMSPATLGNRSIRNWRLVETLRAGGDVTTRNAERIRAFMASPEARRIVPRERAA